MTVVKWAYTFQDGQVVPKIERSGREGPARRGERGETMRLTTIVLGIALIASAARAQSPESAPPARAEGDYTVGIEDVLRVSVWGEQALDLTVRVRPDGKISYPLVNDLKVEGLTPEQIRKELTTRLSAFIREPNVTVIVSEINSFTVYVLGEVTRQGALSFHRPTTLLQALAAAGGLTQYSKKEIVLLRDRQGGEERMRIDYKRLLAGEPSQPNIYLKPGDVLLVS